MMNYMAAVHISESELARDLPPVLEQVRLGREIVIERNRQPVAIISPANIRTRTMSEIISAMEAGGASGTVDEDFARDVEAGIAGRNQPWNPPTWD